MIKTYTTDEIEIGTLSRITDSATSGFVPGDRVAYATDRKSVGLVISVHTDDGITVLWSRGPRSIQEILTDQMSREISNEIDGDIINDLKTRYDV